ncbi:MAG: hypothetical protein AAGH15_15060 [Myxococcota bacterium]
MGWAFRWALALALFAGCGDDDGMVATDLGLDMPGDSDAGLDMGTDDMGGDEDMGMDAGVALCPTDTALLDPLDAPAFAVVTSDFTSTRIAILDAAGDVTNAGWIDSGTSAAGLVATLQGDVVLPTDASPDAIGLVDRFGTDVITRLCPDGSLVGQVRLTPESTTLNLQDFVVVGDEAWASRQEGNPDGEAPELERGTDLIGFDPVTMMTNGQRIDLTEFDTTADGLDAEGEPAVDVPIGARPAGMTRIGDTVVVGLARLPVNLAFGAPRAHGQGTVALVDLTSGAVEGFEMPGGLANCGQVEPVADSDTDFLVACQGWADAFFGDPVGTRATTGIVRVSLAGDAPAVVASWIAADDEESPLAGVNVVSLGGNRLVTVSYGNFADIPDILWALDLETGEFTELARATVSFVIGQGAFGGGTLLVPDAEAGELLRFTVGATLEAGESVSIGADGLQPRSVRAI